MFSKSKLLISGALVCTFVFFAAGSYLIRPLWFDEALTVQNFALLESIKSIYFNYTIPNNQLLYTMMLHFWIKLYPGFYAIDDWMRLLSLLLAGFTLFYTYRRFRVNFGSGVLSVVLITFCCAPPFLLHATALRGYMAGACFTMLALGAALDHAAQGKVWALCRYFFFSLCSVAVLPSDLLALGGVVLYALPCCGRTFWKNKRFYLLCLVPFAALALFYLPIFPQLLQVAKVGSNESWNDLPGVLQAVFLPQLFTFAMLLLPASASLLCFRRKNYNMCRTFRAWIWLLPLTPILLFPAPPFPRVFFPLFPLFVLLTAGGVRDFTAIYCRLKRRFNHKSWIIGLLILSVSWCCIQQQSELKSLFSSRCGGAGRDDFYFPYYLRNAHMPDATARMALVNEKVKQSSAFYFSFNADPWPLMFYLRLNGSGDKEFLFDGPRGMVKGLPDSCTVILKLDEDQSALAKRFPGQWHFLFKNSNHQLWSYSL
jgi:hypothetical protein